MYTREELAQAAGVNHRTIRLWTDEGLLRTYDEDLPARRRARPKGRPRGRQPVLYADDQLPVALSLKRWRHHVEGTDRARYLLELEGYDVHGPLRYALEPLVLLLLASIGLRAASEDDIEKVHEIVACSIAERDGTLDADIAAQTLLTALIAPATSVRNTLSAAEASDLVAALAERHQRLNGPHPRPDHDRLLELASRIARKAPATKPTSTPDPAWRDFVNATNSMISRSDAGTGKQQSIEQLWQILCAATDDRIAKGPPAVIQTLSDFLVWSRWALLRSDPAIVSILLSLIASRPKSLNVWRHLAKAIKALEKEAQLTTAS